MARTPFVAGRASTSARLAAPQVWPVLGLLALLWGSLVGLSRLVLGAHWPSDVLAALCLGMFIPLAINLALVQSRP